MRLLIRAAVLATALYALAGCGPSCADACQNFAKVCADNLKSAGIKFDTSSCESQCQADTLSGKCASHALQTQCLAEAKSCGDVGDCPTCAPTCDEACDNALKVCTDELKAANADLTAEKNKCKQDCEQSCANGDERKECLASAPTCSAKKACAACVK